MAILDRSKKMAAGATIARLDFREASWSQSAMDQGFDRRTLLAAAGIAVLAPRYARAGPPRKRLALELTPRDLVLRSDKTPTATWRFAGDDVPRFNQGDEVDVTISNRLPMPVWIQWRGLEGEAAQKPLLALGPIATGGIATYALALTHAGTLICDTRLGERPALPLPLLPIIVTETAPPEVDHDAVLLIEDWHLRTDGSATPPGADAAATQPVYTVNGRSTWKLETQPNSRLRLRFINGTQRSMIAVKLDRIDVRVIAIDSQPSEPFPARDGRLVMAPGTRIDAIVDLAEAGRHTITLNDAERSNSLGEINVGGTPKRLQALPPANALPSNGLPEKLPLQSALRINVEIDGADWTTTTTSSAPAFRVKRGRTIVLALINPGAATLVFRLQGHHMRLLDRLDDGWKPFWLDTITIPPNQTVRLAFLATHAGAYLMEITGTAWTSPTHFRSYLVEI